MTVDLPAAEHPGAMFDGVHRQIATSPDFVTAIPVTDKHEPLEKKGASEGAWWRCRPTDQYLMQATRPPASNTTTTKNPNFGTIALRV